MKKLEPVQMIFFLSIIVTFSTCPALKDVLKKKKSPVHPYHEIAFDKTCPSYILVIPNISRCVSKVNDFFQRVNKFVILQLQYNLPSLPCPYFFRYILKIQLGNEAKRTQTREFD